MSNQTPHPTANELNAYSLGQLSGQQAELIDQHISDCEPCCETIAGLSADDTFVGLLKEAERLPEEMTVDQDVRPVEAKSSSKLPQALIDHPRYELLDVIGQGGMGRVYKARHRMMDRTVALKVIHREWVRKPEAIDRFRREVKTAASLDHPNVVTAHDAEQVDDLHVLVMEYVNGSDLAKVIKERGPLPIAQACDFIRQAAEGLQYAHERGMVHRDIKPHNLILTKDNIVKILDFGLASLAPQKSAEETIIKDADGNLTVAGAIMGTPDFISPEQAQDARNVDGRSDVYSLGMTLYFLLAGQVPFGEGSVIDKLKQHAEAEPMPLAELRDDVPEEVQRIVNRMIAKDPAERFQSPEEVADALRKIDFGSPPPVPTDPTSMSLTARAFFGGALLLLVAIIGLLALYGVQVGRLAMGNPKQEKVHAPLSEIDSYIASLMASPHELVFLNLSEIGPDENYFSFQPIDGGVRMEFPAFGADFFGSRQGKYADRLKKAAESVSLRSEEKSKVNQDGSIDGVNFMFEITGDPKTVSAKVVQMIRQTFSVAASEDCTYTYRNLPAESATVAGESSKRVSAEEFVKEHARGERVYLGEVNNWIYLIPRDRQAEKQLQLNHDVWIANINELPSGFAAQIRRELTAEEAARIPGTPKTNPAGFLMARISEKHGELVNSLKTLISEAAGIPNDQWEGFARSPTASMDGIKGEPLSLVLLKLNPAESAKDNEDVLKDFRLLKDRLPKPNEFHNAMAFSKSSGFYSMLQPSDMKGPSFQIMPNPEAQGGRITGSVSFHSGTLYQGEVNYVVDVDKDYDMTVTEFKLPHYGITIRRGANGTWNRVKPTENAQRNDAAPIAYFRFNGDAGIALSEARR